MSSSENVQWWQLEFAASSDLEETLLWKLDDLGINRVAIQFSPDNPDKRIFLGWVPSFEWPLSERDRLIETLTALENSFGILISTFTWKKVEDEDWSKTWKEHWQADPVGNDLLILPAWLDTPEEHAERIVLRLDPGSAFGTGRHPTTRLCLEALEKNPPVNSIVADIGCGSGILSLAALGLGAKEVWAMDIDPLAVKSSIQNMNLNSKFLGQFSASLGSVDVLKDELKGKSIDLLLCNILAPVIEQLAPNFDDIIAVNGSALLSGLLVDQSPRLTKIFESLGWRVSPCLKKENWGLLEIKKRP